MPNFPLVPLLPVLEGLRQIHDSATQLASACFFGVLFFAPRVMMENNLPMARVSIIVVVIGILFLLFGAYTLALLLLGLVAFVLYGPRRAAQMILKTEQEE